MDRAELNNVEGAAKEGCKEGTYLDFTYNLRSSEDHRL